MFLFSGIAVSQITDLHSLIHNAGGRFNYPVLNLGRTYPNSDGTWKIQGQVIFDRTSGPNYSYGGYNQNYNYTDYEYQMRELQRIRYQQMLDELIYQENARRSMYPTYPLHLNMNRGGYYPGGGYYHRPPPPVKKRFYRRY